MLSATMVTGWSVLTTESLVETGGVTFVKVHMRMLQVSNSTNAQHVQMTIAIKTNAKALRKSHMLKKDYHGNLFQIWKLNI